MTNVTPRRAWAAWKGFARRAAEIQAQVLFFLLYFVAVVPMGLLRRRSTALRSPDAPRWRDHAGEPPDLVSAGRQS